MAKKKSIHYVNNKEFLAAMIEYKGQVAEAAANTSDDEQI